MAREALLGGSQGLDRLNSTKIAESGQIRARPQKGNIKTERPRAGPERPHHPPHRPPRGPMDAPRWAKAPHDQPTCPSPPAPACYAHALALTGEKNLMDGVHAETKHKTGGAYGKFWDAYTQGPDILEFHMGSRPWGHHHTSSAHPPRCMV